MRPENGVTGTSIRQAGGWWDGRRDTVGYTVQHAAHWVYEGTGLKDGDVFGADPAFPLVGYEADGATFTRKRGLAVVTGDQGTPLNFFILGIAELGEGWVRSSPHAAATMGLYTSDRGGIVFNGATTDWPCLVGRNAEVDRITRNVLDRLRLRAVPILGPLPMRHGRMLAAAGEPAHFHVDTAELPPATRSPMRLAGHRGRGESGARRPAGGRRGPHVRRADAARADAGHRHGDGHGCRPAGRLRDADVRAPVGGGGPSRPTLSRCCGRW